MESYFEQQREVEERINELKHMIHEDTIKRKEISEKLKEISVSEQMNTYGIMVGSVLTVQIIEARELKATKLAGGINPYV